MTDQKLIEVKNLSKSYKTNFKANRKQMLKSLFFGKSDESEVVSQDTNSLKVLSDLSFTLYKGQCLGILGRNGAGKSTFLRVISGLSEATSGSVMVYGNLQPLLSLSSGFNGKLECHENLRNALKLRQIPDEKIAEKIQKIEQFADIGDRILSPFSYLSTGMKARLGFGLALSLEPDILLIDEILSVGDTAFKKKCRSKLHELVENGAGLIVVSHSENDLREFCDNGLVLRNGKIHFLGPIDEAISKYNRMK
jgi:ABC-type polysaccharide/polyol phosphate transport system ATPase subunit